MWLAAKRRLDFGDGYARRCSDAFDPASALTKCLLREAVKEVVGHASRTDDPITRLYALALLQNLCADSVAAERAVAAGVLPLLSSLLDSSDAVLSKYAVGALQNIARAAEGASEPPDEMSAGL